MKILTGNSNRPLAEAISAYLNLPLVNASIRRFSDMEVFVEIQENVRGEDVFVIQPTSYPANDHLMDATRYLVVSGTQLAELAPGYLARTGHRPGVKADYDPFQ